ncbi:MAG: hypothetical protein QOG53_553 [Frankiales bacterium]|nr:hypothetical protein [Frankiales bacterium]
MLLIKKTDHVVAMSITPDTKNWTWVLERPCPECGFDTRTFPREDAGRMLRENAQQWQRLLADGGEVGRRPESRVWSPLEYACHVRDVFRIFDERLRMMLTEDDAQFANWDQDETAITERYGEQGPHQVADEIGEAATALADRFDSVRGDQWTRVGLRGDGSRFTIESFARYLMHDPIHHLHDVGLAD